MAITQHICEMCGAVFDGAPHSKFCPDCKKIRASGSRKKKDSEMPQDERDPVLIALKNAGSIAKEQAEKQAHKGLVRLRCKKCGTDYWAKSGGTYLCPACAEKARKEGVYVNRTCAICGITFLGYPRSKYCPECQKIAKADASRRGKERKRAGKTRSIGSTDVCQNCGKPYTVTSGLQRYCPDCSKYVVAENIREHKRAYMAGNKAYFDALKKECRTNRRVCVICGRTFNSPTSTTVCSAECAAEQMRRRYVKAKVNAGRAKPVRLLGKRGPVNPQSGIPGVHYHPGTGKWELVLDKQYCGLYDTVTAAAEARDKILQLRKEIEKGEKQ